MQFSLTEGRAYMCCIDRSNSAHQQFFIFAFILSPDDQASPSNLVLKRQTETVNDTSIS